MLQLPTAREVRKRYEEKYLPSADLGGPKWHHEHVVAEQAHPGWGGGAGHTPPPSGDPVGRDRLDAVSRAVIESAADAIVAYSTDRKVMLWNPAAERMFGWAADEVIGLEPPTIPD